MFFYDCELILDLEHSKGAGKLNDNAVINAILWSVTDATTKSNNDICERRLSSIDLLTATSSVLKYYIEFTVHNTVFSLMIFTCKQTRQWKLIA